MKAKELEEEYKSGTLDSMALSSFADAMRYLAKIGVFQIKREAGNGSSVFGGRKHENYELSVYKIIKRI
jgi:hypothetical protein